MLSFSLFFPYRFPFSIGFFSPRVLSRPITSRIFPRCSFLFSVSLLLCYASSSPFLPSRFQRRRLIKNAFPRRDPPTNLINEPERFHETIDRETMCSRRRKKKKKRERACQKRNKEKKDTVTPYGLDLSIGIDCTRLGARACSNSISPGNNRSRPSRGSVAVFAARQTIVAFVRKKNHKKKRKERNREVTRTEERRVSETFLVSVRERFRVPSRGPTSGKDARDIIDDDRDAARFFFYLSLRSQRRSFSRVAEMPLFQAIDNDRKIRTLKVE